MPNIVVVDKDTKEVLAMSNNDEIAKRKGYEILIEDKDNPFIFGTKDDKVFLIY